MSKTFHIKSYGCQMNVYDSERMAGILLSCGYEEAPSPDAADLIILNTCHIREKAAEKVYSDVGRLRALKPESPQRLIAVAGCVAQAEGEEIMRRASAVELVFGPQTYHRLPALLDQVMAARENGNLARVCDTEFPAEEKFGHLPKAPAAGPSAFLTVQEGCDKFCTFCVVPYTRGAEYSRSVRDVMREARRLISAGAVEITLLGQNVNAYHGRGEDGAEVGLGGLIRKLAGIEGLIRIRYTTSHPRDMDEELIAVHREIPQCMPYLHLPVQSGSDRVLNTMNRRHTVADYLKTVEKVRCARPGIAISSDFIVGFPGETEEDFEATLALAREVGYAQAYSFKYSPRPGTPAADAENQLPEDVKAERLARLQEVLDESQRAFNRATVGQVLEVLFEREGKHPGQAVGRSPYMQAVHVSLGFGNEGDYSEKAREKPRGAMGRVLPVEIVAAGPNSLEGRLAGRGHTA